MQERLQKLLSRCGIASRRAAENWIRAGRVTVNGEIAVLGQSADAELDTICVDGKPVCAEPEKVYLLLNKPRGFVTTLRDEKGRRTVAELTADCGQRVYPVGRLDLDSEGLLLMTNDGELTNRLTHPSQEVEKTYLVWARGAGEDAIKRLSQPMELDGVRLHPARVELVHKAEDYTLLRMTIHEGRNRQIRRMCQQCGMQVTRLRRTAEGPLTLGTLETGKWRFLTPEELEKLGVGQK